MRELLTIGRSAAVRYCLGAKPVGGSFMSRTGMRIWASSLAAAMLLPVSGALADVPAIKISASNKVAACATPGRLMAFVKSRNPQLDPRFHKIAVEYMRHGESLGLRWDYTFYQMLLETGHLSFRGERGRRGDVSPRQNNFAGLGATGNGASGESFPDVSTGVLAHLQHVLVYAGETVDDPVADRTRKVQEWGILKSMQKRAGGVVTFRHLATKWAPGADYVSNISSLASRFHETFCNIPDPNPDWVAEARGVTPAAKVAEAAPAKERVSGAELAKRAIAEAKASGDDRRVGLGATGLTSGVAAMTGAGKAAAGPSPSYSILNAPVGDSAAESTPAEPVDSGQVRSNTVPRGEKSRSVATASAAGILGTLPPRSPSAKTEPGSSDAAGPSGSKKSGGKCRVWTASYGGNKALIIRVNTDKGSDLTVLDVNDGAEKREAEAYIAAYAKGGQIEAEFASHAQALDKAFELCPEG
jgi:hypothetical protein